MKLSKGTNLRQIAKARLQDHAVTVPALSMEDLQKNVPRIVDSPN